MHRTNNQDRKTYGGAKKSKAIFVGVSLLVMATIGAMFCVMRATTSGMVTEAFLLRNWIRCCFDSIGIVNGRVRKVERGNQDDTSNARGCSNPSGRHQNRFSHQCLVTKSHLYDLCKLRSEP